MRNENIAGIIPARGGSKSIPRKNIRLLCSKPLIYYTIREARKSDYLNLFVVSTEDKEIAEIASGYGAEVIERPCELAQDDTPSLPVYQHAIRYLEGVRNFHPDIIVALQPTCPLRRAEDIDEAIKKLLETDCQSVVSVCEVEHPLQWMYTLEGDKLKLVIEGGDKIIRRQDAPTVYRLNGAVYVTRRDVIMEQNRVWGDDTRAYIMPLERSVDIDSEIDFKLAEVLLKENDNDKDS